MRASTLTGRPALAVFILFTASGFAGIIYESIWSHYLKLFLGHAAYAQTIVLVMFMGGMAAGAWFAARVGARITDLLKAYIVVEFLIGLCSLFFHGAYIGATEVAYLYVFPGAGSPLMVEVYKTLLAGLLILPQSILLGMTFPLMTVGLMRRVGATHGVTIATLYFVNSLGAAIGVLVSGFILLEWFGLPGTMRFAGFMNLVIAVLLAIVLRFLPSPNQPMVASVDESGLKGTPGLLLMIALLTGGASFIYEIVWVRMLNMVLGASTHSFELMLSAFILGLAIGSSWIRRHIADIKHPLAILGFIQVAMATLALATLMFYDFSFALMSAALYTLAKTQLGYAAFMLASHSIALLIMLPVTICAGMTLPLVTRALLDRGYGERSVGNVYASNTIGAIIGVCAAVHLLIPLFSLETALIVAGCVDLAVGVFLLMRYVPDKDRAALPLALGMSIAFMVYTATFVNVDPRKMASGVYRTGIAAIDDDAEILMRRDGKTSSVTVATYNDSLRVLSTNGKPDASMEFDPVKPASRDESTQILTGIIPLVVQPSARRAAIIGIGSGMSTHVLLASPHLEQVDTIEIEAAMVEGARHFLPAVSRAFDDPRSSIHINDARTYFAAEQSSYDIIISEPSNPWVSGVSGLFSEEFYRLIKRHLESGGVLVQWMQLYEIDMTLVASVFKALDRVFEEIVVYETDNGNVLILAADHSVIGDHSEEVFAMPGVADLLARIGINSPADIRARRLGDRELLMPLFASFPLPANSDFAPVLDLGSASRRYLNASAVALNRIACAATPFKAAFGGLSPDRTGISKNNLVRSHNQQCIADADAVYRWVVLGDLAAAELLDGDLRRITAYAVDGAGHCVGSNANFRRRNLTALARPILARLDSTEGQSLIDRLAHNDCVDLENDNHRWIELLRALARRDGNVLAEIAISLRVSLALTDPDFNFLVEAEMFAHLLQDDRSENLKLWAALSPKKRDELIIELPIRLMLAHSGWHPEIDDESHLSAHR
jgi:spermidine synthase